MGARTRKARRYLARPRWGLAYWRGRRGRLAGARQSEFHAADHPELVRQDAAAALAELTRQPPETCRRALTEAWMAPAVADDPAPWWPREPLARLLAALVSLTGARTVLEVGVARGYSSAAILAALEANGPDGRLHSIDLPPLDEDAAAFVGSAIPDRLRPRWGLVLGPSSSELPLLAAEVAPIDLLVHDGDHSYASQYDDLATAWPSMAPGAVAVVDDVWTTAALDFAIAAGERVLVVQPPEESDAIAMVCKQAITPTGAAPARGH